MPCECPEADATSPQRFTAIAALYAATRPQPPVALRDLLLQLAATASPSLVVDLGCGTGLSTRLWAEVAAQVIGIEPNAAMRQQALQAPTAPQITYQAGTGQQTGLPSGCADIVTCAEAFHWMEPQATCAEIARITRPGGVFAAYDYENPLLMPWEVAAAYTALKHRLQTLDATGAGGGPPRVQWPKATHRARMQTSGCFRWTTEVLLHHQDVGTADRLVQLLHTQSAVEALLRQGRSEAELGLDTFRQLVHQRLGTAAVPWTWSYRVRIGIV